MKNNKKCPEWADIMIYQLRQIEVYLGNIVKNPEWKSDYLETTYKKALLPQEQIFDNHKADLVFTKIVTKLRKENISNQQITNFINARITSQHMKYYCSLAEVTAVKNDDN
jgi:hypothetical protein